MTKNPAAARPLAARVDEVVAALRRLGSQRNRDGMARFAIPSEHAFGIGMPRLYAMAKKIGVDHELALALWETGWLEVRFVAAFIDDPELVTPAQMDRWCRDFDNWAVCDTVCFKLFDRVPHAYAKVAEWARREAEFEKRAAFALLASLALHDKRSGDAPFLRAMPLIERAADDDRNFVKKGVSWALRGVGHRNATLHAAAVKLATRLAASKVACERWVGKDALRDLTRPMVAKRLASRRAAGS
jgi:3-methyladenine DNA glycosylase AlkD